MPLSGKVSQRVRAFYEVAPFPGYPPRLTLQDLRSRAARSSFARALDAAIGPDARILEMGAGTAQLSLFLATGSRRVVAADLTRASLMLGAQAAKRFGLGDRIRFVETDLLTPAFADEAFDVVICSGVLHHLADPAAGFSRLVKLVRPGGYLVIGLYNRYARAPHRARRAVARLLGMRFIPFDPVLRDRAAEPARRQAWIRDQYLHPEEHLHSVAEVRRWFRTNEVEYVRTFPTTLWAEPASGLFEPAEDEWAPETLLAQMGWAFSLGGEGGLFVTIGKRAGQVRAGRWRR